jgi:CO/xanthine dehydrogenase FAD-binding subunit
MRIPRFEYFRPSSVEDACSLLQKYRADAKILAGGTDLFVKMKKKELSAKVVISLKYIQGLDEIQWDDTEGLKIGPLVTHGAIANHPVIKEKIDFLAETCLKVGTHQVRNMGTLVGNLCNASPSSDVAAPLLTLGARVKLVSIYGERIVPINEFFVAPFETLASAEEIVAEIQVPNPGHCAAGSYQYLHKASSVGETVAGAAVLLVMDEERLVCREARIGLCSVGPTPLRALAAEEVLKGKRVESNLIKEAARVAADQTQPRSRAWYRREMSNVLVERAILEAKEKIDEKATDRVKN